MNNRQKIPSQQFHTGVALCIYNSFALNKSRKVLLPTLHAPSNRYTRVRLVCVRPATFAIATELLISSRLDDTEETWERRGKGLFDRRAIIGDRLGIRRDYRTRLEEIILGLAIAIAR